jgi:hypothetical protein
MSTSRRPGNRPVSEERAASLLTGSGPSQLGVDASMRGRDVSRPREADIAQAENLVQVSYRPRTHPRPPLPAGGRQPGKGGASPDAS